MFRSFSTTSSACKEESANRVQEQIEKALQQMEDLKIITLVTIPTEWVSSITYPRKPDGTLWICLDARDLNKVISREHYKAPTLKEISHKLADATIFS